MHLIKKRFYWIYILYIIILCKYLANRCLRAVCVCVGRFFSLSENVVFIIWYMLTISLHSFIVVYGQWISTCKLIHRSYSCRHSYPRNAIVARAMRNWCTGSRSVATDTIWGGLFTSHATCGARSCRQCMCVCVAMPRGHPHLCSLPGKHMETWHYIYIRIMCQFLFRQPDEKWVKKMITKIIIN